MSSETAPTPPTPMVTAPVVATPEVITPVLTVSAATTPTITKPSSTIPTAEKSLAATKPKIIRPKVIKPNVIGPKVTKPKVIKPKTIIPKAKKPAVTKPETTASVVTTPKATTPRQISIDFDELRRILEERDPDRVKFLKSKRCKILVGIGLLLLLGILALLATMYTLAFTAAMKTSMQTTTSTTYTSTFQRITKLNDLTTAICDTVAGGTSYNSIAGTGVGNYAAGQGSSASVDFANTTYLNYGNVGLSGTPNITAGIGTGLHVTPQVGPCIVQSIQFQAGNDSMDRDPLTITLEGSNNTGTQLFFGASWTLLYTGPTGLLPLTGSRLAWAELQNFSNTIAFTSYRMIVTSQRGPEVGTEYAEMHLYGLI